MRDKGVYAVYKIRSTMRTTGAEWFLGDNYLSRKACARFVQSIAEDIKGDLRSSIKNSRFVSILSDGSADKRIIEEEIVYVRFVEDGKPHTKLVSVESPKFVNAAGIMTAIQHSIATLKLDEGETEEFFLEFYKKLININFDAILKDIVPGLIYKHCIAHRLELAMLDALKLKGSYIQKFDENINSVLSFTTTLR